MIDSSEPYGKPEPLTESEKKIQRINTFTIGRDFTRKIYDQEGRKMWLLGPLQIDGLEISDIQRIMAEQGKIEEEGGLTHQRCYAIAAKAVLDEPTYTFSMVETQTASPEFTGFPNHAMNFFTLPTGAAISVDYMAGNYIDPQREKFSILSVYGRDVPHLLRQLGGLYTGTWTVVEPRHIKDYYLDKYGTPEQQQRAKENMRQKNI